MSENEKLYHVKIVCAHRAFENVIVYSDFRSSMIANHFFKMLCQNEKCAKRTFVTYAFSTSKFEHGELPEQVFERMKIENVTKIQEKETL